MELTTELSAQSRGEKGKGPSRRLRKGGNVPAVLYSAGKAPVSLTVEPRVLARALGGPLGHNQVFKLKIEGDGGVRTVLVKDVQTHPFRHSMVHADFLEVDVTKPVRIKVPLILVGKNKNIAAGGVIEQVTRKVTVLARIDAIPERIEVDISELKMGQSIHVRDVQMPAGLSALGDGKETVATAVAIREEKVAEVAAAAVPGAVPGAVAPAAGAAGAAGAAAPAAGAAAAAPAAGAKAAPAGKEEKKK